MINLNKMFIKQFYKSQPSGLAINLRKIYLFYLLFILVLVISKNTEKRLDPRYFINESSDGYRRRELVESMEGEIFISVLELLKVCVSLILL